MAPPSSRCCGRHRQPGDHPRPMDARRSTPAGSPHTLRRVRRRRAGHRPGTTCRPRCSFQIPAGRRRDTSPPRRRTIAPPGRAVSNPPANPVQRINYLLRCRWRSVSCSISVSSLPSIDGTNLVGTAALSGKPPTASIDPFRCLRKIAAAVLCLHRDALLRLARQLRASGLLAASSLSDLEACSDPTGSGP